MNIQPSHSIKELPTSLAQAGFIGHSSFKKTSATTKSTPSFFLKPGTKTAILPISTGCLDHCAFCSTVQIKGRHQSYPLEEIQMYAEQALLAGAKEIWLTGQDCACWGFELGLNLATLVRKLTALPGDFKLRLGMGNPRHLLKFAPELMDAMDHPKVYQFIHLPVQSGSTDVLQAMKRKHSLEDFLYLARKFRSRFPKGCLSTDIIVGFPGESEADFLQTMEMLDWVRPDICNRTRYVSRPSTVGAKLPHQLDLKTKKNRTARLTEFYKNYLLDSRAKWLGWQGPVLVNEHGKHGTMQGRTPFYQQVVLPAGSGEIGKIYECKVTGFDVFHLEAEVIKPSHWV